MNNFCMIFLLMILIICYLTVMVIGIHSNQQLKEILDTGEIKFGDDVYTCKLKGTWQSKTFVPVEMQIE